MRLAAEFPERRVQLVFLINNYDLLRGVYRDHVPAAPETAALEKFINVRLFRHSLPLSSLSRCFFSPLCPPI
jgi:hypothetical protein